MFCRGDALWLVVGVGDRLSGFLVPVLDGQLQGLAGLSLGPACRSESGVQVESSGGGGRGCPVPREASACYECNSMVNKGITGPNRQG